MLLGSLYMLLSPVLFRNKFQFKAASAFNYKTIFFLKDEHWLNVKHFE